MTDKAVQQVRDLRDLVLPGTGPVLCDLDGCLIAGTFVFPGAMELVHDLGHRLWIVSNNSYDTAASLSRRLMLLGLPLGPERLLLAGEFAILQVSQDRPGAAVRLFGSRTLRSLLLQHGLRDARGAGRAPEAVVLARDPRFGLAEMAETRAAVAAGAELIVTNTDVAFPGPNGEPQPETGVLLAGLLAMAPNLPYRAVGKPAPALVEAALRRAGVPASDCVFLGDNPQTDGAAAAAAGLPFYHVDRTPAVREVAPC